MLKKVGALLLSTVLLVSLAACGEKDNSDVNSDETETPVETQADSSDQYDVEDEADVVIIGGGGAGMAAAIEAVDQGAEKVIIVEKLPILGGAMRMHTGHLTAPETT